jgi:hypothetical protein
MIIMQLMLIETIRKEIQLTTVLMCTVNQNGLRTCNELLGIYNAETQAYESSCFLTEYIFENLSKKIKFR